MWAAPVWSLAVVVVGGLLLMLAARFVLRSPFFGTQREPGGCGCGTGLIPGGRGTGSGYGRAPELPGFRRASPLARYA